MKSFKTITTNPQSNATRFKFQLQTSKYILAKKVDLNDKHLSTSKSMVKPFQCTVCNFSAKWNCALRKHVKEFHDREKPFKCLEFEHPSKNSSQK